MCFGVDISRRSLAAPTTLNFRSRCYLCRFARLLPSCGQKFKNFDIHALWKDLRRTYCASVTSCSHVDEKVLNFTSILLALYDHHAPFRKVVAGIKPAPQIHLLISTRDKWWYDSRRSRCARLRGIYNRLRNRVECELCNGCINYYRTKLAACKNSTDT